MRCVEPQAEWASREGGSIFGRAEDRVRGRAVWGELRAIVLPRGWALGAERAAGASGRVMLRLKSSPSRTGFPPSPPP